MSRVPSLGERQALLELWSIVATVEPEHLRGYADRLREEAARLLDADGPWLGGEATGHQWSALIMARVAALLDASAEAVE